MLLYNFLNVCLIAVGDSCVNMWDAGPQDVKNICPGFLFSLLDILFFCLFFRLKLTIFQFESFKKIKFLLSQVQLANFHFLETVSYLIRALLNRHGHPRAMIKTINGLNA
jgi:hypothetical protein